MTLNFSDRITRIIKNRRIKFIIVFVYFVAIKEINESFNCRYIVPFKNMVPDMAGGFFVYFSNAFIFIVKTTVDEAAIGAKSSVLIL